MQINNEDYEFFVLKRPHLAEFLEHLSALYEIVIFTASLPEYANTLLDQVDPEGRLVHHRLFRSSCSLINKSYVKDLSRLGRDLDHVIIVDNSPVSYCLQRNNAVPIKSWFEDPQDDQLQQLIPILEQLSTVHSVPATLQCLRKNNLSISKKNLKKLIALELELETPYTSQPLS